MQEKKEIENRAALVGFVLSAITPSPRLVSISLSVSGFPRSPRNSHFAYAIVQEENTLLYNLCSNCWISRRRYFWTGSERNSVTVGGSKNVLVNMDLLVESCSIFLNFWYLILYVYHQTWLPFHKRSVFLSPAIEIHPLSQSSWCATIVGKFKLVLFSCNWFKMVSNWQLHSALYAFYDFVKLAFVGYSNDFISCAIWFFEILLWQILAKLVSPEKAYN